MKTIKELRKEFERLDTVKKLIVFCKWDSNNLKYINIWDDVDFNTPVDAMNWMFEMFQELEK